MFWVWLAAPIGAIIKYSETFLGMKYRKETLSGFDGGPMFFLKAAVRINAIPVIVALLLCVYGVEIYQFNVICESINNLAINKQIVIFALLFVVIYTCKGGIKRVAKICSVVMPFFMICYSGMCFYIIIKNFAILKDVIHLVIRFAFLGTSAIGG